MEIKRSGKSFTIKKKKGMRLHKVQKKSKPYRAHNISKRRKFTTVRRSPTINTQKTQMNSGFYHSRNQRDRYNKHARYSKGSKIGQVKSRKGSNKKKHYLRKNVEGIYRQESEKNEGFTEINQATKGIVKATKVTEKSVRVVVKGAKKIKIKRFAHSLKTRKNRNKSDTRNVDLKKLQKKNFISKFRAKGGIKNIALSLLKKKSKGDDNLLKSSIKTYILSAILGFVGNVIMVGIPVIIIIALIYSSPLAVFFPKTDDTEDIRAVLSGYYTEFNNEVVKKSGGQNITYENNQGATNFMDTLMVYMVLYGTGSDTIGTSMDEVNKQRLKSVFDEMNFYNNSSSTRTIKAGESLGKQVISAYCGCVICCGKWSTPNAITASGRPAQPELTLAVDAYNPLVPMGTNVVIDGMGEYRIDDTGNLNAYGRSLDMYFANHADALAWGIREKEIFLAGDVNEVKVTQKTFHVTHMTYEDYIKTGKLTKDQVDILREVMTMDMSEVSDGAIGELVAQEAYTKLGMKYSQDRRYEEGYYDCSSLVQRLYRDVAGIELPATTYTQLPYFVARGMTITKEQLIAGDLIYYASDGVVSHVAIYVGDGKMIHAANTNRGVVLDSLRESNIGMYVRPY